MMANLIKVKKATAKSWPTKLKPSLIARGEGKPYEKVAAKLGEVWPADFTGQGWTSLGPLEEGGALCQGKPCILVRKG